jgi:hypothetical protein
MGPLQVRAALVSVICEQKTARTLGQDFFARVLDLPLFDFIWV